MWCPRFADILKTDEIRKLSAVSAQFIKRIIILSTLSQFRYVAAGDTTTIHCSLFTIHYSLIMSLYVPKQ